MDSVIISATTILLPLTIGQQGLVGVLVAVVVGFIVLTCVVVAINPSTLRMLRPVIGKGQKGGGDVDGGEGCGTLFY